MLQPQEQRTAYALAGASAVAFLLLWRPWLGGNHVQIFLLAVAFSAAFALVARQGHRLWTAFSAFLLGLFPPWGFAYIAGTVYVAFAFWLGWKAHRSLKSTLNAPTDAVRATPIAPKKSAPIQSGRFTPKKPRPPKRPGPT